MLSGKTGEVKGLRRGLSSLAWKAVTGRHPLTLRGDDKLEGSGDVKGTLGEMPSGQRSRLVFRKEAEAGESQGQHR